MATSGYVFDYSRSTHSIVRIIEKLWIPKDFAYRSNHLLLKPPQKFESTMGLSHAKLKNVLEVESPVFGYRMK